MQSSLLRNTANRVYDVICLWILPIGFFLLLCGMFFLPDRSVLHKIYYALFSIPALIALCLRPRTCKELLGEPVFIAVLLFVAWALISLTWSPDVESISREIKPPLHLLMLFVGTYLLVRYRDDLLSPLLFSAAIVALVISVSNIAGYPKYYSPDDLRLIGGGAFDNPLLSSHLFGIFCVYWLYLSMTCQRLRLLCLSAPAMLIMFAAVLATGSRTPLVALTLAALWLAFTCWNRRSLMLLTTMLVCGVSVFLLFSHMLIERGSSYRFELWHLALEQISNHPFIGHGYEASLSLTLQNGYSLQEPHNFGLGVLYYVGIIGLLPWLFMQLKGLHNSWQYRAQPLFILASAWLTYGIGAALTEGGGILSRPKEHWFLLWIPLALIVALSVNARAKRLLSMQGKNLSTSALEQLTADTKVIEADGLGPKVLQLKDGSFLKLFRSRGYFTSGSFNPYSERFAANSERLRGLGITTPRILALYRLPDGGNAVHYQPLAGQTLRQALTSGNAVERQEYVKQFGALIAQLHEQGVYFRSLHLGNVLLLEGGGFGLIDVADLRIYPSALSLSLRQRNLRHMQRYAEDSGWLFEEHLQALLTGYGINASILAVERLHKQIASVQH